MLKASLKVSHLIFRLGERIIKKTVIVGGTHGNERIGVELVNFWKDFDKTQIKRSTFNTKLLIGNYKAVALNKRYCDHDLNRQFITNTSKITHDNDNDEKNNSEDAINIPERSIEKERAIEIQKLIGEKSKPSSGWSLNSIIKHSTDFLIDLHSSTSNVGLVCMISAGINDVVSTRIA